MDHSQRVLWCERDVGYEMTFAVLFCALQVVALMSTDLLRSQQRWKDACMEVRKTMADLQQVYGFSSDNMRPWRAHFDRQLYKARRFSLHFSLSLSLSLSLGVTCGAFLFLSNY